MIDRNTNIEHCILFEISQMLFQNIVLKFVLIIVISSMYIYNFMFLFFYDMHYIILIQILHVLEIPNQCFDILKAIHE